MNENRELSEQSYTDDEFQGEYSFKGQEITFEKCSFREEVLLSAINVPNCSVIFNECKLDKIKIGGTVGTIKIIKCKKHNLETPHFSVTTNNKAKIEIVIEDSRLSMDISKCKLLLHGGVDFEEISIKDVEILNVNVTGQQKSTKSKWTIDKWSFENNNSIFSISDSYILSFASTGFIVTQNTNDVWFQRSIFGEHIYFEQRPDKLKLNSCQSKNSFHLSIPASEFDITNYEKMFRGTTIAPYIIFHGEDYKRNRKLYRELRIQAENEKDRIGALYYYKNEMQEYYSELKDNRNNWFFKKDNWFELVTVWSQMVLSVFGNSWWRPLWLSLVFSLIFTPLIILESKQLEFTTKFNWDTLYLWLHLINPTHKGEIDFMGGKVTVFGFADVIYRILIGFMIFYILKGLRKYTYK